MEKSDVSTTRKPICFRLPSWESHPLVPHRVDGDPSVIEDHGEDGKLSRDSARGVSVGEFSDKALDVREGDGLGPHRGEPGREGLSTACVVDESRVSDVMESRKPSRCRVCNRRSWLCRCWDRESSRWSPLCNVLQGSITSNVRKLFRLERPQVELETVLDLRAAILLRDDLLNSKRDIAQLGSNMPADALLRLSTHEVDAHRLSLVVPSPCRNPDSDGSESLNPFTHAAGSRRARNRMQGFCIKKLTCLREMRLRRLAVFHARPDATLTERDL